jgi:hypothetical protein
MTVSELEIARELFQQGGWSIETFDDKGNLAIRTVFQLDGDVICWISRVCAQQGETFSQLAERHWETVGTRTAATETALLNVQNDARKWILRARSIGKATTVLGIAGSILSYLRGLATPTLLLSFAITLFGFAFWRWGPRLIGGYLLRHLKTWLEHV